MSDDNGEAASSADATPGNGGSIEPGGFDALPAADDPSTTGRLDTIHRTLSTLGMRMDALVTSTTSYRSALTDRLTEYAELVSKLTRTQASDLEEYRRANERTIADMRRSLSGTDEVMERVGARIDSLLTDSESSDDQSRLMLTEVRSILEAQESLSRFLTESLDQFGERVLGQVTDAQASTTEQIEALQSSLRQSLESGAGADEALQAALTPLREGVERIESRLTDQSRDEQTLDRLAGIDERIGTLAQVDPAAALAGWFDAVHAAVAPLATADQVSQLSADREALTDQLARIESELDSSGQVAAESWGEFAGLRAKVDAILETSSNETGAVSTLLDEVREALIDVASGEVVGALWDEFRAARQALEALSRDADDDADDDLGVLRDEVSGLTGAVRDLLEQAEVIDEANEERVPDPVLVALASDLATLRDELAQGLVVEPSDALAGTIDQLRVDLAGLDDRMSAIAGLQQSVADLRDDATLVAVAADVSALRAQAAAEPESQRDRDELRAGLTREFETLRTDLAGLDDRMSAIAGLQQSVADLRDDATLAAVAADVSALRAQAATEPESQRDRDELRADLEREFASLRTELVNLAEELRPDAPSPEADDVSAVDVEGELQVLRNGVEGVDAGMRSMRTGIEDIIARLDEGLVIADDISPPAAAPSPELADQLASMRDQVSTEFDALRQMLQGLEAPADPEPDTTDTGATGPVYATVDPDTVDLLREEIRTAGSANDDLVEAIRKELIALRRRIKLRAEGEVFSAEQLEAIAESVARRLAE